MSLDPVRNAAVFPVSLGYDNSATLIILSSDPGNHLPDPATEGAFNLIWWNASSYPDVISDPNLEIIRCTGRTGAVLTIIRAQEGTLATPKNIPYKSYKVAISLTKKMIDDIRTGLAENLTQSARLAEFQTEQAKADARANLGLSVIDGGTFQ